MLAVRKCPSFIQVEQRCRGNGHYNQRASSITLDKQCEQWKNIVYYTYNNEVLENATLAVGGLHGLQTPINGFDWAPILISHRSLYDKDSADDHQASLEDGTGRRSKCIIRFITLVVPLQRQSQDNIFCVLRTSLSTMVMKYESLKWNVNEVNCFKYNVLNISVAGLIVIWILM